MKLFDQGVDISQLIFDKAKVYRHALRTQSLVVVNSADHSDHIAAYMAWQDTPGQILIMSPLLPSADRQNLLDSVNNFINGEDSVFFHTSGTTKSPKVIQHKRSQFATFAAMSQTTFELDRPTRFLSFLPPFTSAFWHIVIPSFYQTGFELHLSSRDRVIQDLSSTKFDVTAMVSNFTDFFRSSKQSFDFSAFRLMLIGGAPVVNRHAEFLFEHGATMCAHAYGTTECGSPLLARKFTQDDQHYDHIDLVPTTNGVELKLVDNELWVKSPSLCENYQSFSHEGSWWRTGDLWQQDQGLIKFIGRNDDVVKVNGYPANLLEIEHWWEAHADLGECTAKPRSIGGNDYIELLYTKEFNSIEKENLKARAKELFPPCNVPVKFTQIDLIPRTSLGKKQRYLVK